MEKEKKISFGQGKQNIYRKNIQRTDMYKCLGIITDGQQNT